LHEDGVLYLDRLGISVGDSTMLLDAIGNRNFTGKKIPASDSKMVISTGGRGGRAR